MQKSTVTCGEVWVLGKLAELLHRHGLNPTESDIYLTFHIDDDRQETYYTLQGADAVETSKDEATLSKVWKALGMNEQGNRRLRNLGEVSEVVDQALLLAPRVRTR